MNKIFLGTEVHPCNGKEGMIFVATAKASLDGKTYSASSYSQTFGDAEERAKHKLNNLLYTNNISILSHKGLDDGRAKTPTSKNSLQGGGTRPMSEPQKSLIIKLCNRQGIDAYELCRNRYNMDFDEFKGQDADRLIKELTQ